MPDLKKYWDEVRGLEKDLEPFVWLVSLHNPARGQVGGRIMQVTGSVAAKLLHAGSHRKAEGEEVEKHLTAEESSRKKAFTERLHRSGVTVVPVGRQGK